MKRLLFALFAGLILLACVSAQSGLVLVLYRDAPTLTWDAVTTNVDGEPLLPDDEVTYDVYAYDMLDGVDNDQDVGQLIYLGLAGTNELVLDFPGRRYYAVGVRTRVVQGDGTAFYAERIAWSVNPDDVDLGVMGGPFAYAPTLGQKAPASAQGLRDSGM